MIKLIATDVDGTFLDENSEYDIDRFDRQLKEMERQHIRFVVATGNQFNKLKTFFPKHYSSMTFIAENGAHIVENDQTILRKEMDKELLSKVARFLGEDAVQYALIACEEETPYILRAVPEERRQFAKKYFPTMQEIDSFDELPEGHYFKGTIKVPLSHIEEVVARINQEFAGQIKAVSSGFGAIDLIQPDVTKAWALNYLLECEGISTDEVMALGDGDNDIEMLRLVTHSYAMGNAKEHVKQAARHVAPSNTENGFSLVVEELLKMSG